LLRAADRVTAGKLARRICLPDDDQPLDKLPLHAGQKARFHEKNPAGAMSDLYLSPMAPPTPLLHFPGGHLEHDLVTSHTPLQRYSMFDVPAEEDPTMAWVRALPSPDVDCHETNRITIRSDTCDSNRNLRKLETPRPDAALLPDINFDLGQVDSICAKSEHSSLSLFIPVFP